MERQFTEKSNGPTLRFRIVCEVFACKGVTTDEIDVASLDDVLGELNPLERQIIALRLEADLSFPKTSCATGLKTHQARRIYQTALTKLRQRERLQKILAAVTPSWRVHHPFPAHHSNPQMDKPSVRVCQHCRGKF